MLCGCPTHDLHIYYCCLLHSHFRAFLLVFAACCDMVKKGNEHSYLPHECHFLPSVRNFDGTRIANILAPGSFDSLGYRGFLLSTLM